ncbi:MAG: DnaD domain protein [Anaerolineales bacterium]
MKNFKGFTDSETFTQLPDSFFNQLLNEITDADELKVTLYAIWHIEHMDGPFRALCETDFDAKALGLSADGVVLGLEKAVERGSLLKSQHEAESPPHLADIFYFLNSPRGRAAAEAFAKGNWRASAQIKSAPLERPNVFKLYEENIGPLTPLIADALKDAESTYSEEWVADAVNEAVLNNARSWKYIDTILKNWKRDGRAEKQNRRDAKEDNPSLDRKIEQLRKRSS